MKMPATWIQPLDFSQMVEIGAQNTALQKQLSEPSLADDPDQAGGFQFFEMMRNCRCADGLALAEVTTRQSAVVLSDLLENFVAARIG